MYYKTTAQGRGQSVSVSRAERNSQFQCGNERISQAHIDIGKVKLSQPIRDAQPIRLACRMWVWLCSMWMMCVLDNLWLTLACRPAEGREEVGMIGFGADERQNSGVLKIGFRTTIKCRYDQHPITWSVFDSLHELSKRIFAFLINMRISFYKCLNLVPSPWLKQTSFTAHTSPTPSAWMLELPASTALTVVTVAVPWLSAPALAMSWSELYPENPVTCTPSSRFSPRVPGSAVKDRIWSNVQPVLKNEIKHWDTSLTNFMSRSNHIINIFISLKYSSTWEKIIDSSINKTKRKTYSTRYSIL